MVQNKLTYQLTPKHMEKVKGVSMTLPDESLTVKEIFERYVRGQPLDIHARPTFYGNNDIDSIDPETISRMDMSEKYELQQTLKQENAEAVAAVKAAKAAKAAQKVKEAPIVPPAPAPAPV